MDPKILFIIMFIIGEKLMSDPYSLKFTVGEGENSKQHKMSTFMITASDGFQHILWYDPDFVKLFSRNKIYVDGTFNVRPKFLWTRKSQFLTIMAKYEGRVSRSSLIMYVIKFFLSKKTRSQDYRFF